MTTPIPTGDLEKYLWGAAVLLRGQIDASGYKEFIFPLLFFKRICDVYDEEFQKNLEEAGGDAEFAAAQDYIIRIPEGAHWRDVRKVAENIGAKLVEAFMRIEAENPPKEIEGRLVGGLTGIFGDKTIWTNKAKMPDAIIVSLLNHFSKETLSIARCPADEMGTGYEYLVGQFANDAGHTAQEFYTNRTVVTLMAQILRPAPGESIYDPTCGSGGMLIKSLDYLKSQGLEYRSVRVYGQEVNPITSAIARMNLYLHGVTEFSIQKGDTLSEPKFIKNGQIERFNVVLANPPYSIKTWNREKFAHDVWSRNILGTPPQGRADYAFIQHILASIDEKNGRCAILLPHGVLFREEEKGIRKALLDADLLECVIGLAPNLFYNSPMEACIMICRANKSKATKGKVLFINAVNEVTRKNAESKLEPAHIEKIIAAYAKRESDGVFSQVATREEIAAKQDSLAISLYAHAANVSCVEAEGRSLGESLGDYIESSTVLSAALDDFSGALVGRAVLSAPQSQSNEVCVEKMVAAAKGLIALSTMRVKLGDVADEVRDKWNGSTAGVPVVGLEHLEPDEIWLRQWEKDVEESTFTKAFRKGQLLLGRRRVYLKKLSLAPCDGICSGDITVVAAKPKAILPELLPFYLRTDSFFDYAMQGSAGSLSPRVKWAHLANYEFDLPPLDRQRELAERLWAANDLKEKYKKLITASDEMLKAKFREMFGGGGVMCLSMRNWPSVRFVDVCVLGPQNGFYRKGAEVDGRTPTLKMKQLFANETMETALDCDRFLMTSEEIEKYRLTENDLVFGRRSIVPEGAGKCRRVGCLQEDTVFESSMLRVTLDRSKADPRFVQTWTEWGVGAEEIAKMRSRTTIVGIKGSDLKNMPIALPPLALQQQFVEIARKADETQSALKKSIADVEQVIKGIVKG